MVGGDGGASEEEAGSAGPASSSGSSSTSTSSATAASADGTGDDSTAGTVADDLCEGLELYVSCSKMAQNCPDGQRCTDVMYEGYSSAAECVAEATEPRGLDEACGLLPPSGPMNAIVDDCAIGLDCVGDLETARCRPFCGGDRLAPSCEQPSEACVYERAVDDQGACAFGYCSPRCDPLAQDCAVGVCDEVRGEFVCVTNPRPPTAPGVQCWNASCGPNRLCVPPLVEGCLNPIDVEFSCEYCYVMCDVAGPPCESGSCVALKPNAESPTSNVGVCRPPGDGAPCEGICVASDPHADSLLP